MVMAGFVPAMTFHTADQKMLRRIVSMLIVLPLAIVIVAFAVANRQSVTVSFDPLSSTSPAYAATLPLFVLIFVLMIFGVLIGGAAVWIGQTRWRRTARKLDGEVRSPASGVGLDPPALCARIIADIGRPGALHR